MFSFFNYSHLLKKSLPLLFIELFNIIGGNSSFLITIYHHHISSFSAYLILALLLPLCLSIRISSHEYAYYPVIRVKRKCLLQLILICSKICYLTCFDLNSPGDDSSIISNFAHTDNYLWLFYAIVTFKVHRIQLIRSNSSNNILFNTKNTFLWDVEGWYP